MKTIHTDTVRKTINSYAANRVTGSKPPDINKEEVKLSRNTRCKLSQLRSGFSSILNDYKHRIDENIDNICPKCHLTPHDTNHLFNCPSDPTTLRPIDLWKKPARTADFLKLDKESLEERKITSSQPIRNAMVPGDTQSIKTTKGNKEIK